MKFSRKIFFDGYRTAFGGVTQIRVAGLTQLLDFIEADPYITKIPWASYELATTAHETDFTFHPIHEYGGKAYFIKRYGGQTKKGKELGNDTPEEGYYYSGAGYSQTTGEANYEKAEKAIRAQCPEVVADFERRTGRTFDLTVGDQPNDEHDPANMLDPAIAYATMSYGMRTGMFTGHKFSEYSLKQPIDYSEWRRMINGKDRAATIAGYARKFEKILNSAVASPGELAQSPTADADGNTAGSDPAAIEQPPTSSDPTAAPMVTVPAVSAAPSDTPTDADKPPTELEKIGNKANAIYTSFGTMVAGVIAWFSSSSGIIVGCLMGAVALLGISYMVINALRANAKDKRDREDARLAADRELQLKIVREQHAQEAQMYSMKTAADPTLTAVTVAQPPAVAMPNSDSAV